MRFKDLVKIKGKKAGKNRAEIDGCYQYQGMKFFIKKPALCEELIAELFAGLLLAEFKKRGLIPEALQETLIHASLIEVEEGNYALIQPFIDGWMLWELLNTANRKRTDRDPFYEWWYGRAAYSNLPSNKEDRKGLSLGLFYSLLFGDKSVHSGNVIVASHRINDKSRRLFCRLDWGASFRSFGHEANSNDILTPVENQGAFNLKKYTQNYIFNYIPVPGLLAEIVDDAKKLQDSITDEKDLIQELVKAALQQIPPFFYTDERKQKISDYLCLPSFQNIEFNNLASLDGFAADMAEQINKRLGMVIALENANFPCVLQNQAKPSESGFEWHRNEQSKVNALEELKNILGDEERLAFNLALEEKTSRQRLLIADLLRLQQFYEEERKKLDEEKQALLHAFYESAVQIRLSQDSDAEQQRKIYERANECFKHENRAWRLFQDVLLVISCLFGGTGFQVGYQRMAKGNTFFLSQEPTRQEKWLAKHLFVAVDADTDILDEDSFTLIAQGD